MTWRWIMAPFRQISHFDTGDLEVTIASDFLRARLLIEQSYEAS